MDKLLYVAMAGAKQSMLAQQINTHNLANVSTPGFRADLFNAMNLPVYGPGYPTRVYSETEDAGVDLSSGAMMTTGRNLDVAVKGEGLIAVVANDGTEAYTRAGNLTVSANGQLTTGSGHPVMGNSGPIAIPPFERLEIGTDGTISIQAIGQDIASLVVVDRIKLVKPEQIALSKNEQGLLITESEEPLTADASVGVISGVLESSNVNAIDAMVNMITLAREYEINIKMMQTSDEDAATAAQIMSLS